MLKSYGATTAPSHCTIYYYKYYNYYVVIIIIIINIIFIIIIIIICKGYFRVNPILVFVVLKLKKVLLLMWS